MRHIFLLLLFTLNALTNCTRLVTCAAAFWFCLAAHAQISPGPLSRAHQQLEGVARCGDCHDFGAAGARGFKCLDCHTEIRSRIEAQAGFHARAYKKSATQTACSRCHMEHNGQAYALIRLDRKTFDHAAETGFSLEGKHREQRCESCHTSKKIGAGLRAGIKVKDLNRTFLGLRRECASCHEDKHDGQLGAECIRCHTQEAWKPAAGFNHSRTSFPLTGLHQAVGCRKCHVPRTGETTALFKGLPFGGCQNCHSDPHRGAFQEAKFRGSCSNCHNTNGWKNNHPGSGFNHTSARFPLNGRHADLACGKCHKSSDFHLPIAHERCGNCHEDLHRGQFAARAAGSDCAACHSEAGFKPSRFDREMHSSAAFPLEGKHASLACGKCHQPEGRSAVYKTGKLVCFACHEDRHGGEFASAPIANQCNLCHTQAGFQPAAFSLERHAQTRFPLTGRHASVDCAGCHKPLAAAATGLTGTPRRYHFASQTCNSCHTDPHTTRLACENCHETQTWKAARPYDHAATGFALERSHQNVKCIQCHAPSSGTAPTFGGAKRQCTACHSAKDPHRGQFTLADRQEDCAVCHTTAAWNPAAFNHDQARFALDVAHRNVACIKCHKDRTETDGKTVRLYRGTPTECVQCH